MDDHTLAFKSNHLCLRIGKSALPISTAHQSAFAFLSDYNRALLTLHPLYKSKSITIDQDVLLRCFSAWIPNLVAALTNREHFLFTKALCIMFLLKQMQAVD
jgi:hypothetical protein